MNPAGGSFGLLDPVMLAVAATVLVLVAALLYGVYGLAERGHRKRSRRRLQAAAETGRNPEPTSLKTRRKPVRRLNDEHATGFEPLLKGFAPQLSRLNQRLQSTGTAITVRSYLIGICGVGSMVAVALLLFTAWSATAIALVALGAALYLPRKYVTILINRRQTRFMMLFPEALELMVRGLRSGIPVNDSMRVASREVPEPVGSTFQGILDSMSLGRSFSEALAIMSERLNLADFHFFEIALGIQQETGGNLAETLDGLATTLRRRKQMKLKVKAMSSEARASAYILGSLPFLMFGAVDWLNPDYMGVLLHDPRGHIVLGLAAGTLALGIYAMIKMGQFEI